MPDTDAIVPMIFGTADIPTYEALQRRRAIAAALAAQKKGFPKTLGEGLTYLGESIGEAGLDWRLRQEEARSQGYSQGYDRNLPPIAPVAPIGGSPPPPAAPRATVPGDTGARPPIPGSDPALPPTLSPAPVSAAPAPAPAPVAAAPEPAPAPVAVAGGDSDQPEVASAPDLPAPDVTSSEAPPRSMGELPPEAKAALVQAFQAQQEQRPPPVQQVQPVREAITNALMMSPQREAERPAMEPSVPPTTAAFAPPADPAVPQGDRAPLQITVGGPQDMKGRSIGAYLKPTDVPRGAENLDPRARTFAESVKAAYPGVQFTSGYRSPQVNAAVGGAPNSEHMRRLALDMDVSKVPLEQRGALLDHARRMGAQGFGNYGGNSIHIDFREGGPAAWGPNRSRTSLASTPDWFRDRATQLLAGRYNPAAPQVAAAPPPAAPIGPPVTTLAVRPSDSMGERPPVTQAALGGDQQDAVLQDVTGGGMRPGMRGATASLGRAGVMSDAGPESPIGAGISASIDARRNAIAGAASGQPAPAPADPAVQVAQAPGGTTVDSDTIFNPRPVKTIPIKPSPVTGIEKAPATLPSQEAIPGQPPSAGPVAPFQAEPMSARERALRNAASDPRLSDAKKAIFAKEAAELEQDRRKLEDRKWDLHKSELERYYKDPEKQLAAHLQRAQIEEQKAKARMRPDEIAKATADRQIAEQNLIRLQRENSEKYVEQERLKKEADLAAAQRTATKPDEIHVRDTVMQRPPTLPGQPPAPYEVPPGAPPPKQAEANADQAKASEFVIRVRPDMHMLDTELKMGQVLTKPEERARDLPGVGNMLVSQEYRLAKAAMTNFKGGFMQRVSGAAVNAQEAERNLPAFDPAVGDTPRDLAEKSARRHRFLDAAESSSGEAGKATIRSLIQESSDSLYAKQLAKEPVQVRKPGDELILPPGQRFITPDGREMTIPRKIIRAEPPRSP